jgi:hypothetical protein
MLKISQVWILDIRPYLKGLSSLLNFFSFFELMFSYFLSFLLFCFVIFAVWFSLVSRKQFLFYFTPTIVFIYQNTICFFNLILILLIAIYFFESLLIFFSTSSLDFVSIKICLHSCCCKFASFFINIFFTISSFKINFFSS